MADLPVTGADIAIAAILVISGLLAFARGFVHEVLSVGGWIGAILAAFFGVPYARPYVRQFIDDPMLADIAAGVGIFVVTLVVLSFLKASISSRVQDSALGALDRSLGFLFGLARGAVFVALVYIGVEWMLPPAEQPAWLRDARAMPLVERGATLLKSIVPADARAAGAETADEVRGEAAKALETQRMLRDMMSPKPDGAAASETTEPPGYDERAKRGMDRLIESVGER